MRKWCFAKNTLAKTLKLANFIVFGKNWQKMMARPSAFFSHNKQGNM